MPSWKESYTAGRKYRTEWEKMYPWIEKCKSDNDKFFCKVCNKELQPRKVTIQKHGTTQDHLYKSTLLGSNNKIAFVPKTAELSNETKQADLQLAVATCCHNSIASIDHFVEITKKLGKGSSLEDIRLYRIKCSLLIKSVVASSLNDDTVSRIKGKKFCILADESTDISCEKYICICVRFFDDTTDQIETCFLGLVSVIDATGESLFNAISTLAGDLV